MKTFVHKIERRNGIRDPESKFKFRIHGANGDDARQTSFLLCSVSRDAMEKFTCQENFKPLRFIFQPF